MLAHPVYLFIFYLTLIVLAIAGLIALRLASRRKKISSESAHWLILLGCWVIIIAGIIGLMATLLPNLFAALNGAASQENLFIFYLALTILAAAGLLALRFASGRGTISSESTHWIIILGCWAIIIGGMAGLVATSPSAVFGVALSVALLIILVLIPASILITVTVRPNYRSEQNALLWSMTIAAEKMIPLAPTIEAFSRESSGQMAVKARILAKLLESGIALPDALERVPGILPARVLPLVRMGCDSGNLARALRQTVSSRDSLTIIWNSLAARLVYIAMVITFGIGILTFVLIKIVPSYEKIFRDFRTDLPVITKALMEVSYIAVQTWFIFLPLYLLFIVAVIYFMLCYLGWASLRFPEMSRFLRRRHSAIILDSLALAAEGNQPLGNSVLTLAGTYPQSSIRRKLSYVGVDIHQGGDWSESLCRHGLIKRADQAVLKAAQRVGNLPWAMREMADSNRRRLAYRLSALVQVAYPPVIICMGLMVLFIVVALFYPLVNLVMRLSGG
jgi:protein transport protein HofC